MGKVQPKRRRKAMRKSKIEDVEEALEDERMVDKLKRKTPDGKHSLEMPELFTVDTAGSGEGLSRSSRRAIARAKIFPPKGPNIGMTAMEEAKVARAERQLPSAKRRKGEQQEVFDLWSQPLPSASFKEDAAAASMVRRVPQKVPLAAPKTLGRKLSAAPAVLPAHEGQSVNPDVAAFEDLVCMAAARELEKEQEAEAMERKMRPITFELRDVAGADAVKDLDEEGKIRAYREMVCPLPKPGEDGEGGEASGQKGKFKIKSQAQRNREKKRKNVDAKAAQLRQQRKLEKSVGEVGAILKDMKAEEKLRQERKAYRESMRLRERELEATQGVVPKGRRLGRTRLAEDSVVVAPSEAVGKGLRSMPLRGATAVRDRMASIVRRGLLPAPAEATRQQVLRHKKHAGRIKRSRKFISPLLRDNLLLR